MDSCKIDKYNSGIIIHPLRGLGICSYLFKLISNFACSCHSYLFLLLYVNQRWETLASGGETLIYVHS